MKITIDKVKCTDIKIIDKNKLTCKTGNKIEYLKKKNSIDKRKSNNVSNYSKIRVFKNKEKVFIEKGV